MSTFTGLYTALVSPFCDGAFDGESFIKLLHRQEGIDGIVIGGTTGEMPTLRWEELRQQIVMAGEHFSGKVIVAVGSNDTAKAIRRVHILDQIEAIDVYLVIVPSYNSPNQVGIFEHFSAIAKSTRRPIILYSISRGGNAIGVDTVINLVEENDNIVGIKESADNGRRIDDFYRLLGEDFSILSGNDPMTLPFMVQGAVGVLSPTANILGDRMKRMVDLANAGKFIEARGIHREIVPLMGALLSEPSPVAIKHMLAVQGIIRSSEVRLPLCASSAERLQEIEKMFSN
ncbi:MAG: 4-hydroxy-tetrahydrodipicolinate synthase [Puniceicoccales bacterium]|jgi:4-hydroxy-tetrahydrodipicolinate synthase|nr:4-hydroxy-tetrahydrodipicolinate synthase [Puniceicoccales bacterium]